MDKSEQIVVLTTSIGEDLVIRANPTDKEVQGFITEMDRRLLVGEPAGNHDFGNKRANQISAYTIHSAARYANESAWLNGDAPVKLLKVKGEHVVRQKAN